MLKIEVPRSVTAKGRAATRFALASLLIAGVLVLLVLILRIRQMIPEACQPHDASRRAHCGQEDLTVRLALNRDDELGVLAREFDIMVDKLATRVDASSILVRGGSGADRDGVLHNVGNAMTPLGVTVVGMQKRLREAPVDDRARAGGFDKTDDPARRAELEQFLRLASREAAQAVTDARAQKPTPSRRPRRSSRR
jgi:hypothetical protein